ncbi:MAG: patatin-like phospholipase family protein [Gemmatimonadota bacterium]|nr:MAG: patatin-like phospholipase family protein [Gemmatimonadota bacterium]
MNGLVLTGGGARAAYQVGVLSYIAEKAPDVRFPIIVGVSAGAINAAFLAGHRGTPAEVLERLSDAWACLTIERIFRSDLSSLSRRGLGWFWAFGARGNALLPQLRGLLDTTPLREFLEERLDIAGIEDNVRAGRLRALALTATRYATGQTVTFVQGAPDVPTWERARRCGVRTQISEDHVMASGALPLIFPAIMADGEYYGDGSIRQAAPLAPAIHLGTTRLLAISTRYSPSLSEVRELASASYPPPARVLGMLFNTVFLDTLEGDAERLQRLNRLLALLPPGTPNTDGLRRVGLHVIRPSRDLGKLAEGYQNNLPRSLKLMLRGLGVRRLRGAELLSYLIFEQPYLGQVIELGYEDALSNWGELERFLVGGD